MTKSIPGYPKQDTVEPDALRPNSFNTNVVSPENEAKLDAALRRFGFFKPIIVREVQVSDGSWEFEILGGEHRWESAKRLGITEIPIMNIGPVGDATAKEISLADNARYGVDDSIALAEMLSELGDIEDLQHFLPYSETDVREIFASVDIDLDTLEYDEDFEKKHEPEEPAATRAPKTHTVMRFKVSLGDAEKITTLITKTQKKFEFTSADELTNAGDALVHLLLGASIVEDDAE